MITNGDNSNQQARPEESSSQQAAQQAVQQASSAAVAMVTVLGLSPADFASASGLDDKLRGVVDRLVPAMLDARQAARERSDWAEADRIRDALAEAGVAIEDTPSGARWRIG